MIIDAHTHLVEGDPLYSQSLGGLRSGIDVLLENMDACGIDKSIIFTVDFRMDPKESNDKVASVVRKHNNRLIGFGSVHPRDKGEAVEEVRRCVEELGLRGLKFHPWLQAFKADDSLMYPIVEEAIKLNVPIIFHSGTPPYTLPLQVACLCDRYPEAKIILGHMGMGNYWLDAVHAAERHPNIILETSSMCLGKPLALAIAKLGARRFIFGSDNPLMHPAPELAKFKALNLTDDELHMVLGENIKSLVGLY
ncbi:MAG: amidohydrolase [Firmicutes bacterium]|nr:amidohydrolase [Bacillota bacterium]